MAISVPAKHPFKRLKDKVALVGMLPETRELAPYDDESYEIWAFNEEYQYDWLKRYDRWFQMHPLYDCLRENNEEEPHHPDWLRSNRDYPIYMLEKSDEIPNSVAYPLKEVFNDVTPFLKEPYFLSTPAYAIALAIWMGYKTIGLYGLGMVGDYRFQRTNSEFLIGIAMQRGIKIEIPEKSLLCKGLLYGYKGLRKDYV